MRINAGYVRLFDAIAVPTGQAEVIKLITAAQCLWNDVINREQGANHILLALAVAATMESAPSNFSACR
jgi:hypothetical protein